MAFFICRTVRSRSILPCGMAYKLPQLSLASWDINAR
nr:MAG TPA: hypothetical protein [Caudoviricetes sp.]